MINFKSFVKVKDADYVFIGGRNYSDVVYKKISPDIYKLAYFSNDGKWENASSRHWNVSREYLLSFASRRGVVPIAMTTDQFEQFYMTEIY